ncbi:MAG TPA: hypothetical protein VFA04_01735 [Bryobacteraceae bacterium]|nr:hypothetical protein [Bryobacteraceae bacterium]
MATAATQFRCLELIPLRWPDGGGEYSEFAVLHEIGSNTGIFQVEQPAPAGTAVSMTLPHGEISGVVRTCTPEESGYILDIGIECRQDWLDGRYRPSVLIPLSREPGIELPLAS